MKLALLLVVPLALLALVRDVQTGGGMDAGLIAFGGVVILGAYGTAQRVKSWADRQGPAGMGIGIALLLVLAFVIVVGGAIALTGVQAGR